MGAVVYKPLSSGERRTWTLAQRKYLLAHHKDMYIEDIALELGRTLKATKNKACRMGCSIKTKPKSE